MAHNAGCEVHQLGLRDRLLAGAAAGLSYWVGTYPLDVVKVFEFYSNFQSSIYFQIK